MTEAPRLWRLQKEYFALGNPPPKGTIWSFTKDNSVPEREGWTAFVQTDQGKLIATQLTDLGNKRPEIGMRVEPVVKRLRDDGERGPILYGFKYRLVG